MLSLIPVIGFLVNESLKDNEIELEIIGEEKDIMIESADNIVNGSVELSKGILNYSNFLFSNIIQFTPQNEILLEQIIRNQEEMIDNQYELIAILNPDTKPILETLTTVSKICQYENEENCITWKVENNLGYDNVFCINKIAFGTLNIIDYHLLNDQFPQMKGTQLLIHNVTGLCD